jgi:rhodanese-related sulfurtransferase
MTIIQPVSITDDQCAMIVDVRTADEFARERIAGSLNCPLDQLPQFISHLQTLPQVILSCQSGKRAQQALGVLSQAGLTSLGLLDGGLIGWKAAGRPTIKTTRCISIMRQVQIIVGAMVLAGILYPPLRALAVVAGLGMTIAGLTGTCMLASLLAKMPWNASRGSAIAATCQRP